MSKNNITFAALKHIINLTPGNFYWKNDEGKYLGCNDNLIAIIGWNSPQQIIGKTLPEIIGEELAKPLLKNDNEVIESNKEVVAEESFINILGERSIYLARKMPMRDEEGNVIGMVGSSLDITDRKKMEEELIKAREEAETALKIYKNELAEIRSPDSMTLQDLLERNDIKRYYIMGQSSEAYLTRREAECLAHLAKGKSAKQVGKILALSPRTIEFYLEKIKHKFSCRTQTELIATVVKCRFLKDFMPTI